MKTDIAPEDHGAPKHIFLKDYTPAPFEIAHVDLRFDLAPDNTRVFAKLKMNRRDGADPAAALVLNGEKLELIAVKLDGAVLAEDRYILSETHLTIGDVPDNFTLETEVKISPDQNTALSGLYISNGMFCTQCEAEGFRRITYYLDRPDVLSTFTVRVEADKKAFPVLLANGNPGPKGALDDGRHFAEWFDPHPKPAYLFALVAGDLAFVEDHFTTQSGREVTLQVFVQPSNIQKCGYTLDALKRSMRWDEDVFGREYDLDIFMIVAVDHFNFGAMENKGLNIFNSAYVLASPTTATDRDYELIEGIVAHEYFHNWSGNRVTCRDWFQLCLKEGFTVFRDQEFSADMRSRSVQRIKDVRQLWARQFPEDAGPLAHPARPDSYITIDNFYTATVYEKGAELARMIKTLIGPDAFRQGSDLYFDRHDGQAATVDDFLVAMEDASGTNLNQFRRWYSDAGTPHITVNESFENGTYQLTLSQKTLPTPGQDNKPARHMPVVMGLIGKSGPVTSTSTIELKEDSRTLTFDGLTEKPIPSLFRGFSAPVIIHQSLTVEERLTLIAHDVDPFNRWSQARQFSLDLLKHIVGDQGVPDTEDNMAAFAKAIGTLVQDATLEPAYRAEVLSLPSETDLARALNIDLDPDAIAQAVKHLKSFLADRLGEILLPLYTEMEVHDVYSPDAKQAGRRALRNNALSLWMASGSQEAADLAVAQATHAQNMTDEAAAVSLLARSDRPERAEILANFHEKWQHEPLVINKWLAWQAMAGSAQALEEIIALTQTKSFDAKNPNKVRSLIGVFAMENMSAFHRADGAGYDFFFAEIKKLDKINPQVAARLIGATESWRRVEPVRRKKLEIALKDLLDTPDLSKNLFEMTERLLG